MLIWCFGGLEALPQPAEVLPCRLQHHPLHHRGPDAVGLPEDLIDNPQPEVIGAIVNLTHSIFAARTAMHLHGVLADRGAPARPKFACVQVDAEDGVDEDEGDPQPEDVRHLHDPNRKYGTPVSGWLQQLVSRIGVPDHAPA